MTRNNIIAEIQEKDLEQLQKIMKQVFNSNTSDSKAQRFYEVSKNNSDIYVLGYYIENNLVGTVTLKYFNNAIRKRSNHLEFSYS